jgi:hypothetical protein
MTLRFGPEKIFEPEREAGEDYVMRSLMTCALEQILWGWLNGGG